MGIFVDKGCGGKIISFIVLCNSGRVIIFSSLDTEFSCKYNSVSIVYAVPPGIKPNFEQFLLAIYRKC